MTDFLLDKETHDLVIQNNDFVLASPNQIVAQRIKQKLLLNRGEWFIDTEVGIPYIEEVFVKNFSLTSIEALFVRAIREVKGVAELRDINVTLDKAKRILTVDFVAVDDLGNIIDETIII